MRSFARRLTGPLAAFVVLGAFLGGSVALAAPSGALVVVTPCTASIDPGPTVVLGTDQTLLVTGLTANGGVTLTSTHNSSVVGPGPAGNADGSGEVTFTQAYALGTWTYAYHDDTSGAECSVSWTVVAETPTTTTTPPATVSPAAATPVAASPAFTG
ncbi:MAG TPA: hypothetical protein VGN51_05825 [Acidimicrobiia bacterium]